MTRYTGGRLLLSAIAVFAAIGPFAADWNATHLFNPNWPPHARFHNGQTMAAGPLLAIPALYFLWRRSGDRRTNDLAGILFAISYFAHQAAANAFPGVAWTDPEFLRPGQTLDQFPPQLVMNAIVAALLVAGAWLIRSPRHPLPETSP